MATRDLVWPCDGRISQWAGVVSSLKVKKVSLQHLTNLYLGH
jgi:hypothetical protein